MKAEIRKILEAYDQSKYATRYSKGEFYNTKDRAINKTVGSTLEEILLDTNKNRTNHHTLYTKNKVIIHIDVNDVSLGTTPEGRLRTESKRDHYIFTLTDGLHLETRSEDLGTIYLNKANTIKVAEILLDRLRNVKQVENNIREESRQNKVNNTPVEDWGTLGFDSVKLLKVQ